MGEVSKNIYMVFAILSFLAGFSLWQGFLVSIIFLLMIITDTLVEINHNLKNKKK